MYPNIVTTVTIGASVEGRPIKGVIIDHKPERESPLKAMIEGGIHSREWISPATVTWIIKEFLNSTDPEVKSMAEAFVWHIFPVINPDGYAYSFTTVSRVQIPMFLTKTAHRNSITYTRTRFNECEIFQDRMWRKNRNTAHFTNCPGSNDLSNGIDLNRNFNFVWMSMFLPSVPANFLKLFLLLQIFFLF